MKRICMLLMFVLSMVMASHQALAQEVTITLWPGWNWISYPNAEVMDIASALGDFVPMNGDMINSQFGGSTYTNGHWRGGITHFMPGWGYMYYSNREDMVSFVFSETSPLIVTTSEPTDITAVSAVVGGTITLPEGCHVFLRGVCWGTEPNPDIDGSHTSDSTGTGLFSSTLDSLSPNTTYYVRAYVVSDSGLSYGNEVSFTTLDNGSNDHENVDLGLPSGTLWATYNIGANAPEEYGDYFAWGETQPKDYYDWSTYQYCMGNDHSFTKYCNNSSYGYNGFTDNLTTLLPEDDAATANWGTDWRIPTEEEWQELYDNTACIWTTQNGVNGRLFTASNGNSLFIPAAGIYTESGYHWNGSDGYYWSSLLYTNKPSLSWELNFNSNQFNVVALTRYAGRSVRAVRSTHPITSYTINAVSNPTEGGSITGTGTYEENAICTLTALPNEGYTFTQWTENDEVVSNDAEYSFAVAGDRSLVANFVSQSGAPIGAIDGLFTINTEGDQVYFSQGNLQYQASTSTWRFAESQWDYVGTDNSNISSTYDGWIDLFGWGTSGYHNVYDNFNVNYQPYSSSATTVNTECNYYGYGPSTNMSDPNLTGLNAGYDWGVHNAISNGGNQVGLWHTLSGVEWEYVFFTRSASTVGNTSNARFAKATVNGIQGVILFPDVFSVPIYLPTPLQINSVDASFGVNSYSGEGWNELENLGCVFLPKAGSRSNYAGQTYHSWCTYVYTDTGSYWSSSYYSSSQSYYVFFNNDNLYPRCVQSNVNRFLGFSVRLVRDAE